MVRTFLFFLSFMGCSLVTQAKVQLPQLFQTGMVLQRDKPIPIWGKANAHEQVTILWQKKQYATMADAQGHWRIDLPKTKAGGPYVLEIKGESQEVTEITDVLVGDVWLCSGQSNVDVTIERVYPLYTDEIDAFHNNQVRLFRVQNETNTHGVQDDIRSTAINWKPLTKQNAWQFSAIGSFLGKRMNEKYHVPQGIIVNSWGGTPIEAWISVDSLQHDYPMMVEKTRFYQDDELVEAQQRANQRANDRWFQLLNEKDPGIQQHFMTLDFDDSSWHDVDQYSMEWAKSKGQSIVGSIWLRQHIHIDKTHAGQSARLLLGTLFDADYTYLNGQEIGRTYYQYPPRRYDIPAGMLREGDNVITIRFVNKYGTAHFIKEKPYLLAFGDERFSQSPMPKDVIFLSNRWKHHAGAEIMSCPSSDVSLQNMATTLFNAVLYPLAPYALAGVVWYQGESNTGNPGPYADLLKKMMGCWRDCWKDPLMPFCIVQLANYDGRQQTANPQPIVSQAEPVSSNWAQLREAQRLVAKADPCAELAVINDLGETVDIHPLRKKEVAERIGLCFERLVFNNKVRLSPEVVSMKVEGEGIRITLDQPIQECEFYTFEVADKQGIFHNVNAVGKGNIITLRHFDFEPTAIRYAWKDNPLQANVRSLTGLPMSSFEWVLSE